MKRCKSWERTLEIPSSRANASYAVTVDRCECMGFRYRQYCRHVAEFNAQMCLWDEAWDGDGEPLLIEGECPRCGDETVTYGESPVPA